MDQTTRIPTNLRTLRILEVLGSSEKPMTATEINAHLGLPKQTVHRLCKTLEEEGFLTRYGTSLKFQASRRLRRLGAGLLNHSHTHVARRQILVGVAKEVKETVNFAVPADDGMRYADRVETDWAFRVQLPIGSSVPFHCTASGKCFLKSLSETAQSSLLQTMRFEPKTANTHTNPDALLKDLKLSQDRGYAVDNEEFIDGMVAIAVPVYDDVGNFMAALAFHGPTQRLSLDLAAEHLETLKAASEELTEAMFAEGAI